MDDITKIEIRRGQILEALQSESGGMSDSALGGYLVSRGDDVSLRDVREEMDYLSGKEKEYTEFIEKKTRLWIVKLTPRGKDLLQENTPEEDPGIKIIR